jgi:Ca-activated chloride channel family protein
LDLSRPECLWLLVPWLLLLAWAIRGRRRRVRHWKELGQSGSPPGDGAIGGLLSALLLILSLCQPRWGRDPNAALPPGRDVVLMIDVSRSMGAEDAVPSRLGVAIDSARGLIEAMAKEEGDRVAVVAFAGAGAVRCGLTGNLGAAGEIVRRLRVGTVRPGGTDLGAALGTALGAFDGRDRAEGRLIVIFTDGEDHPGGWRERVGPLREAGVIVDAVAIGDPEKGQPVPAEGGLVLSYRGRPVVSKRSDEALEALAKATGGMVLPIGLAAADMRGLYEAKIAPAARQIRHATHPPERAERYGLFVLAALLTLTFGTRPRGERRSARRWGVAASLGALLVLGADSPRSLFERGRAAYQSRKFEDALTAFAKAAEAAPTSAVPPFNAGAALFALGRYDEAAGQYRRARDLGDPAIRVKAGYALGNALMMADDPESAIAAYDECLADRRRSKGLDAIRRDAAVNREYARQRIRQKPSEPEKSPEDEPPKPAPEPRARPPGGDGTDAPGPRGQGGAGGDEPDARKPGGPSPEERLDDALERIREAQKHRLPEPPARSAMPDGKDW